MWRHLPYAVCIGGAALLAPILVAVVVWPELVGLEPSPWLRRLCAWGRAGADGGLCLRGGRLASFGPSGPDGVQHLTVP